MSSQSLAALRKSVSEDLRHLANEHLQHDDTLEAAAGRYLDMLQLARYVPRVMQSSMRFAMEKPTTVQFADGRTEPIPDIIPHLQPTRLGDAATYFFFSIGGLFLGSETGFLTGSASAERTIIKDPETRSRIEKAFQKFKADVLKKELQQLEDGESSFRL